MSENHDDFQKSFGYMVAGFGFGMLVGSIMGLLFAPKSGKELRSEISERGGEYYGKARTGVSEAYGTAVTRLNDAYAQARDALDMAYATGKDFTADKVDKIKSAVEEGVKVAKEKIQRTPEAESTEA
jgi:gas vesicle protein